jgi:hypothetical protein
MADMFDPNEPIIIKLAPGQDIREALRSYGINPKRAQLFRRCEACGAAHPEPIGEECPYRRGQ